eukprot:1144328-Pelagomonas_calceolata.AAC.2
MATARGCRFTYEESAIKAWIERELRMLGCVHSSWGAGAHKREHINSPACKIEGFTCATCETLKRCKPLFLYDVGSVQLPLQFSISSFSIGGDVLYGCPEAALCGDESGKIVHVSVKVHMGMLSCNTPGAGHGPMSLESYLNN